MIGEIKMFAGSESALDINHIPCDGRALSRAVYSELFAIIGTLWGSGDGSSTFNIPDLRDKFIRGSGSSRAVASFQAEQNASHSHSVTVNSYSGDSSSAGAHTHTYPSRFGSFTSSQYYPTYVASGNCTLGDTLSSGSHTHSISHSHTADCALQGGSELRPANIALLYVIQVFDESSSGSGGLSEEQANMLQTVSDFVKFNCKLNEDGSYDYTKFKSYQVNGETLWLSDELLRFVSKNYWQ